MTAQLDTRTIRVTLTSEQFYALQLAAEEAANGSPAEAGMALMEAAWEYAGPPEPAEAVRYSADQDAPAAGAGGTPTIKVVMAVEITGEWITPEVIRSTAREVADVLAARLRESAEEIRKEGM